LLLQAFGLVVLLTGIFLLGILAVVFIAAGQNTESLRPTLTESLEAYYLARGSWEGIERLPTIARESRPFDPTVLPWQDVILLNETGHVVLDHGRSDTPLIGESYPHQDQGIQFALLGENRQVGTLVMDRNTPALSPLRISTGFLLWTIFLSFFPAVLTVIIALLLARRLCSAGRCDGGSASCCRRISAQCNARGPGDLRALIESFNQMAAALERNDRGRRDMLADIAHAYPTHRDSRAAGRHCRRHLYR
jgi:hypothetical protein